MHAIRSVSGKQRARKKMRFTFNCTFNRHIEYGMLNIHGTKNKWTFSSKVVLKMFDRLPRKSEQVIHARIVIRRLPLVIYRHRRTDGTSN